MPARWHDTYSVRDGEEHLPSFCRGEPVCSPGQTRKSIPTCAPYYFFFAARLLRASFGSIINER